MLLYEDDVHMSIFYSGPQGEPQPDCSSGTCRYQILHASGDGVTQERTKANPDGVFNRKVVINGIGDLGKGDDFSAGQLANPVGFGRIKLWD